MCYDAVLDSVWQQRCACEDTGTVTNAKMLLSPSLVGRGYGCGKSRYVGISNSPLIFLYIYNYSSKQKLFKISWKYSTSLWTQNSFILLCCHSSPWWVEVWVAATQRHPETDVGLNSGRACCLTVNLNKSRNPKRLNFLIITTASLTRWEFLQSPKERNKLHNIY